MSCIRYIVWRGKENIFQGTCDQFWKNKKAEFSEPGQKSFAAPGIFHFAQAVDLDFTVDALLALIVVPQEIGVEL